MDEIRTPRNGRQRPKLRALPRWVPVPLGITLGFAAGAAYGLTAPPHYAATGYVIVVPQQQGDASAALGFAQAYGRVVTGDEVLAGAQATTHRPVSELRDHVQAATSPDAPMISVTGTARRPGTAADIANAVAEALTATANRNADSSGVRLVMFSPASAPSSPTSPSARLSATVGASAGGLLGGLVLLVRPRERRANAPASVPGPAHEPAAPAKETV